MEILFSKISDQEHALTVRRHDGSTDSVVLNSRSFLRHDLAHLAVELEVPINSGFWGSVAGGTALSGNFKGGPDMALAEKLAGPIQTLLRTKADTDQFLGVLNRVCPELASWDLAARIRERGRRLQGHWQATPYGEDMLVRWDPQRQYKSSAADAKADAGHSGFPEIAPQFAMLRYGTN